MKSHQTSLHLSRSNTHTYTQALISVCLSLLVVLFGYVVVCFVLSVTLWFVRGLLCYSFLGQQSDGLSSFSLWLSWILLLQFFSFGGCWNQQHSTNSLFPNPVSGLWRRPFKATYPRSLSQTEGKWMMFPDKISHSDHIWCTFHRKANPTMHFNKPKNRFKMADFVL